MFLMRAVAKSKDDKSAFGFASTFATVNNYMNVKGSIL